MLNGLVSWDASIGFSFGIPSSMGNDLILFWTAAISVFSDWVFCTVDRDIRHFSLDSPCLCFNAVTFYSALSQFLAMILYWAYMNEIVKIILARFIVGGLIHFLTCHPRPHHYGKVWSPGFDSNAFVFLLSNFQWLWTFILQVCWGWVDECTLFWCLRFSDQNEAISVAEIVPEVFSGVELTIEADNHQTSGLWSCVFQWSPSCLLQITSVENVNITHIHNIKHDEEVQKDRQWDGNITLTKLKYRRRMTDFLSLFSYLILWNSCIFRITFSPIFFLVWVTSIFLQLPV